MPGGSSLLNSRGLSPTPCRCISRYAQHVQTKGGRTFQRARSHLAIRGHLPGPKPSHSPSCPFRNVASQTECGRKCLLPMFFRTQCLNRISQTAGRRIRLYKLKLILSCAPDRAAYIRHHRGTHAFWSRWRSVSCNRRPRHKRYYQESDAPSCFYASHAAIISGRNGMTMIGGEWR